MVSKVVHRHMKSGGKIDGFKKWSRKVMKSGLKMDGCCMLQKLMGSPCKMDGCPKLMDSPGEMDGFKSGPQTLEK